MHVSNKNTGIAGKEKVATAQMYDVGPETEVECW